MEYRFGRRVGIAPNYDQQTSPTGRRKVGKFVYSIDIPSEPPPQSPEKPRGKLHVPPPDHTEDPEVALNKSFGRHKRGFFLYLMTSSYSC